MLTDPQTVTVGGSALTYTRKSVAGFPARGVTDTVSNYETADGLDRLTVIQYKPTKGHRVVEINLSRRVSEPDSYSGNDQNTFGTWNSVGLRFVFDAVHRSQISDLSLLRTALSSLVDSTLLNRLIGGES